jgi:hypothetical protein
MMFHAVAAYAILTFALTALPTPLTLAADVVIFSFSYLQSPIAYSATGATGAKAVLKAKMHSIRGYCRNCDHSIEWKLIHKKTSPADQKNRENKPGVLVSLRQK